MLEFPRVVAKGARKISRDKLTDWSSGINNAAGYIESVFLHSDTTISSTGTEKMHESAIRFSMVGRVSPRCHL